MARGPFELGNSIGHARFTRKEGPGRLTRLQRLSAVSSGSHGRFTGAISAFERPWRAEPGVCPELLFVPLSRSVSRSEKVWLSRAGNRRTELVSKTRSRGFESSLPRRRMEPNTASHWEFKRFT
jgi:hypothetical protein